MRVVRTLRFLLACITLAACSGPTLDGVDVTLANSGAGNPTVAVAGNGALATWIETVDGVSNVYIATLGDSGRSEAVRVNDIDGDAAPHEQAPPQVAATTDGTVYVVWQNNTVIPGRRFPASNLRIARSDDGARTFAPAVFVNDDALGTPSSHTFHDIAVADDGTVYVSWIDGRAREAERAGGMSGMHGHGSDGTHAGHDMPHDDGTANTMESGSEIRIAKSTDGGRTFTPGVVVERNACPCCRTSLAIGADGNVAVAYRSATDDIRDIVVVRSTDGGETFGDPVVVHRDGWRITGCPHAGASIAFGLDGRIHVAWYTGQEDRQGLWYAVSSPDGTSFGEPEALQAGGFVPVSQVKLDVDRSGRAWIAWDDRRDESRSIRLATHDGRDLLRLNLDVTGSSPAIAVGDGSVVLGWQNEAAAAARLIRID